MPIVYVLSNPAFEGYVKVGRTVDLEQRLRQLDNTSVPLPFRCENAYGVAVRDNGSASYQACRSGYQQDDGCDGHA